VGRRAAQYKTVKGEHAEIFDLLVAATGVSPRLRELPLIADAVRTHRAPVVVGGPVRYRLILDDSGRWKNLPPLYPMGAHAVMRAGFGANTLASATVYLPLTLPHILKDAGLKDAALEPSPQKGDVCLEHALSPAKRRAGSRRASAAGRPKSAVASASNAQGVHKRTQKPNVQKKTLWIEGKAPAGLGERQGAARPRPRAADSSQQNIARALNGNGHPQPSA
jgi:hypothetical protein